MFAPRTGWQLTKNRFSEVLERQRATGAKLLDLTLSNPTHAKLTYDSGTIRDALAQAESLSYDPEPFGLPSARAALAGYYRESHKVVIPPEQILLTASTSEAYSFLFRLLCNPGDQVLIGRPSYPLFDFLAEINDVQLRRFPLFYDHGWHIDVHAMEQALSPGTRAIVVVHPNNPTGSFVSLRETEALSAICRECNLALIVDEVFLDYTFKIPPNTFAGNGSCLTFTLSGLSKMCGLPQVKLAWCVASGPADLLRTALERLEVIADTYLSVNTPVQTALPALLATRTAFQTELKLRLKKNLAELDRQLGLQSACTRLTVDAGWYVVLRVPAIISDEQFVINLIERQSVVAHPGAFFDFPGDGYLVVSLLTREEEFAEGVRRVIAMASEA